MREWYSWRTPHLWPLVAFHCCLDWLCDNLWLLGLKCIDASLAVGRLCLRITAYVDPVGVATRQQFLASMLECRHELAGEDAAGNPQITS